MTIEQTLAEVSKHLQELELPGILTVVPPGDARIPEAAREMDTEPIKVALDTRRYLPRLDD